MGGEVLQIQSDWRGEARVRVIGRTSRAVWVGESVAAVGWLRVEGKMLVLGSTSRLTDRVTSGRVRGADPIGNPFALRGSSAFRDARLSAVVFLGLGPSLPTSAA